MTNSRSMIISAKKTEFCRSSIVLSVQTIECFETNVARFHGLRNITRWSALLLGKLPFATGSPQLLPSSLT